MRITGLLASMAASLFAIQGCAQQEASFEGEPGVVNVRRISETQYRNTIADLFGEDIEIRGRFEPDMRDEGLLAVGSAKLSITPSGFEQYFSMAASIAEAVLSDERRADTVGCDVQDPACTRETLSRIGYRLYRRPLSAEELVAAEKIATDIATRTGDAGKGLQDALTSLLVSPAFLFRVEIAEPVPGQAGQVRLDAYSKASRLAHFFWDASPDEALLEAAATGEIHDPDILDAHIERMLASPRAEQGTRAFFKDVLQFDKFATLNKDPQIYPKYSLAVAEAAQEQTLLTLTNHLVVEAKDYRDIFTTRQTFINRSLASVYKTPYLGAGDWVAYEAPEERAGVLTQTSFLSAFSHPGRSSPTLRGVAVNEIYLCQPTPLPPANVDFSIVNDTDNTELRTVRQRLMAHSLDDSCSNCHDLSDPVGLTLEHFDAIGQRRLMENGELIDVAADINGVHVNGAQELGFALRNNPNVPACLVQNLYAYGIGRAVEPHDNAFLEKQARAFARADYRYPELLRQIATAPEFFSFEPLTAEHLQAGLEDDTRPTMGGHQ